MRIEPSFLFDLGGALVDSVYQHVLACSWSGIFIARSACAGAYLPISCCARLLLKSIPGVLSGCNSCAGLSAVFSADPPTRRAQAARLAHRNTNSLGYRYQRPDGDGAANLATLNVDPCKRCDNHARSGQARKAGSGSVPGRSRPSRCSHRKGDCGRGQYLRYARANALPDVGDRTAQRRIQFR
jgi:hypothetical protein